MPNKTTNYNLTKPLPEDFYDIGVQNANMDIIDDELKKRIPQLATYYPATSGMSADDLTDAFALIPISAEINAELYKIVGGTFAYVWTSFYSSVSTTSRRIQIAASYNTVKPQMAFRCYSSTGWLPWEGLGLASKIPASAADLGAFPSTGGVLTGQMTIKRYDNGHARFNKNHSDTNDYGTTVTDFDKDGKSSTITVRAREDKAYFTDNNGKYHELYHDGNLPDTTYVPVTSEVPVDSDIWIDPDDVTAEEGHLLNTNNPHNVTAEQVSALPAIESTDHPGCYYRVIDGVTEWFNPPMTSGVEYRLTKRYNGEPVYTMVKDFGAFPNHNSTTVSLSVDLARITNYLSLDVFAITNDDNVHYKLPFYNASGELRSFYRTMGSRSVWVNTLSNLSSYNGRIVAEYTKQ